MLNRIQVYIPRKLFGQNWAKTPDLRKNCSTDGIWQIRIGFSLTSDGNGEREDLVPSDSTRKSSWLFELGGDVMKSTQTRPDRIYKSDKILRWCTCFNQVGKREIFITVKIADDHWLLIVRDICPCSLTLTKDWLWFGGFLNSYCLRFGLNADTQSTSPQIQIWNHCALLEETFQIHINELKDRNIGNCHRTDMNLFKLPPLHAKLIGWHFFMVKMKTGDQF